MPRKAKEAATNANLTELLEDEHTGFAWQIFENLVAAQNSRPSSPDDLSTNELAEYAFDAVQAFQNVANRRNRMKKHAISGVKK